MNGEGHWEGLNTATPQKILPNTASPQEKSVDHCHRNIYFQFDDFSVSTRQSFQDFAFDLKKISETTHNEAKAVVTLPMPFDLGCYVHFDSRILKKQNRKNTVKTSV